MSSQIIFGISPSHLGRARPKCITPDDIQTFDGGITKSMIENARKMAREHIADAAITLDRYHKNLKFGSEQHRANRVSDITPPFFRANLNRYSPSIWIETTMDTSSVTPTLTTPTIVTPNISDDENKEYTITGNLTYDEADPADHHDWASAICTMIGYMKEVRDSGEVKYDDGTEKFIMKEYVQMILLSFMSVCDIMTQIALTCAYIKGGISAIREIDENIADSLRTMIPPGYSESMTEDLKDLDLYVYGLLIPLIDLHNMFAKMTKMTLRDDDISATHSKIVLDDGKNAEHSSLMMNFNASAKSVRELNPTILL